MTSPSSLQLTNPPSQKDAESLSIILQNWALLPNDKHYGDRRANAADFTSRILLLNSQDRNNNQILARSTENGTWLALLRKLAWDSEFFGFDVGKLDPLVSCGIDQLTEESIVDGVSFVKSVVAAAAKMELHQLVCPVHSSDTISQIALQRNEFFVADTIVCYKLDLLQTKFDAPVSYVRLAQQADVSALRKISGDCFADRKYNVNRFNSDVQFSPQLVRGLYQAWIENSVNAPLADVVFVAEIDGALAGFITAKLSENIADRLGSIPLNAVDPKYHNRGIYKALVNAALEWFLSKNVAHVEIRTQLPNSAVHRTWQKLGAQIASTYHTFHMNLSQYKSL